MNSSAFPDAVFMVDAMGLVTGWNSTCERLTGYNAAQIRGHALSELIVPDFAATPDSASISPTGSSDRLPGPRGAEHGSVHALLVHKDGARMPVHVSVVPQFQSGIASPAYTAMLTLQTRVGQPAAPADLWEAPLTDFIEMLPCLLYVIDQNGHLLLWNKRLEDAVGLTGEALTSSHVRNFFIDKDRGVSDCNIREAFRTGQSSHEATIVDQQQRRRPFLFNCARISLGGETCIFGTGFDISQRKEFEARLLVHERAIQASVNAIVITRCAGNDNLIEYVNPSFEHITGYTQQEILGRDPRFMRAGALDLEERQRIRTALRQRQSIRSVLRNQRKNGEIYWNELRIDPVVTSDGEVTHFVGVINDVTEAKNQETQLHHLANHDPLTGLANRALLYDRLKLALAFSRRQGGLVALVFLDLDDFKAVNDHFGHDGGDIVLCEVARRLRRGVREGDTVARVGGDEFVLVLNNEPSADHVRDLVERLLRSVTSSVDLQDGKETAPGVSIGIALYPHDGQEPESLMQAADAAMYHAKAQGKNNYQFYSRRLSEAALARQRLEASLDRAIVSNQLFLEFLPKIDLSSAQIIGSEALVRWRHPVHGVIQPAAFITVAEECGLIRPLGAWVMESACKALKELQSNGFPDFSMSVNVSAHELQHEEFVRHLAVLLESSGVKSGSVELEIVESQLMDNPPQALPQLLRTLAEIKALGVRLSIDDFGMGYSSLKCLQKFAADFVKIDKSFLHGPAPDRDDAFLIKAVISLGHSFDLKVIAEGVETPGQLAFLRAQGCDQMQGHYFSAALSQARLREMLGVIVG